MSLINLNMYLLWFILGFLIAWLYWMCVCVIRYRIIVGYEGYLIRQ